jgi:hypothetical protein
MRSESDTGRESGRREGESRDARQHARSPADPRQSIDAR